MKEWSTWYISQVLGQVSISAFKNVLNIGFHGKDGVYLRKVLQSQQVSSYVIYLYLPIEVCTIDRNVEKSVKMGEEQGLQVNLWQLRV